MQQLRPKLFVCLLHLAASLLEFYCALHFADANKHVEKLFLIASRKQGRRQVQVGYIDSVDSAAAVYFRWEGNWFRFPALRIEFPLRWTALRSNFRAKPSANTHFQSSRAMLELLTFQLFEIKFQDPASPSTAASKFRFVSLPSRSWLETPRSTEFSVNDNFNEWTAVADNRDWVCFDKSSPVCLLL